MAQPDLIKETKADLIKKLATAKFTVDKLDQFFLTASGITFYYDFSDFPYTNQTLAPDRELYFSFEQLPDFLLPDGYLAHEIKTE